jgi:hypothetical protein
MKKTLVSASGSPEAEMRRQSLTVSLRGPTETLNAGPTGSIAGAFSRAVS